MNRQAFCICALLIPATAFQDCMAWPVPPPPMRVGVHGPGRSENPPLLEPTGIRVFRYMFPHEELRGILDHPAVAGAFEARLSAYEGYCVESVISIRQPHVDYPDFDVVPLDAADREARLVTLRQFAAAYAPRVHAFQLGNEIFGGPGTLLLGTDPPKPQSDWSAEDLETAFVWFEEMADALRLGIGDSGCSAMIVAPAMTAGFVRLAARGAWNEDLYGPRPLCRVPELHEVIDAPNATAAANRLIQFANTHCDALDAHLHTECLDDLEDVLNLLQTNPYGKLSEEPNVLTCLEWSAALAVTPWLAEPALGYEGYETYAHVLFSFYERAAWCKHECEGLCDEVTEAEWNGFVSTFDAWLNKMVGHDLDQFACDALATLNQANFRHACYSVGVQSGLPAEIEAQLALCEDPNNQPELVYLYDVTTLRTTKATFPAYWNGPALAALENALTAFTTAVCPRMVGDLDLDNAVTPADAMLHLLCFTGPGLPFPPGWETADVEGDCADVDLADFARLQAAINEGG